MPAEFRVMESLTELSRAAAELFVDVARRAVDANGRFSVSLAGGNTPKPAYELLGSAAFRGRVDWSRVHVFWGDERCVPPDHAKSNYRMTREALLDHVSIPAANVHRIRGELSPPAAAADCEADLRRFFAGSRTAFDLVFLGLGDNAHTASLWPGTSVVDETQRLAAEVYVREQDLWRVTLTAAALNAGRVIAFVVAGADKAVAVREVLSGPRDPHRFPAQLIQPTDGKLIWLLDRPANSGRGQ